MKTPNFDTFTLDSGLDLPYWKSSRFASAIANNASPRVLANACRMNILSSIKAAGSGHIGTSFSSIEIILACRYYLNNSSFSDTTQEQSGIFFSSKGHDAPSIYAAMHMLGEISDIQLFSLRRLDGLPGHPEITTPGVPTNTGSLGMGISKAKGFIHANRINGVTKKVIVLLGDGELQEGQIWEALPTASRDDMSELIVIVDGNRIQSDSWVKNVSPNQNLEAAVKGHGWNYLECNGHSFDELLSTLEFGGLQNGPTFIYAKTIKGCGVEFIQNFSENGLFYKFHSGSVSDRQYSSAISEITFRIENDISCTAYISPEQISELNGLECVESELDSQKPKDRPLSLISHWAEILPKLMSVNEHLVVLDADLSYDTGTYIARKDFPDRYIQAGIAEQDMVSMAGTLALSGKVPIVHSFASFLTMRPTEQIFNNATEHSQIIYMGFLAGLLPSPPGFSHQALTDVGIMATLPNIQIIEPSCKKELELSLNHAIASKLSTYVRIASVGDLTSEFTKEDFRPGGLVLRKKGSAFAIVSSGPWLTEEAIKASDMIGRDMCAVYTYPFLNSPPIEETIDILEGFEKILVLENFTPAMATTINLMSQPSLKSKITRVGLYGIPKNGWNSEVMRFHGLDSLSLVDLLN